MEICSSGALGIPMTAVPQPVLVISADKVQSGDCGSWAMSLQDGTFIGMLIGASPTLGDVYLLRMSEMVFPVPEHKRSWN